MNFPDFLSAIGYAHVPYSGRNRYGAKCWAIHDVSPAIFAAAILDYESEKRLDPDTRAMAIRALRGCREDSMGRGSVLYFPTERVETYETLSTLANTVCEVARNVFLDPPVETDGDNCVRLGEFTIERTCFDVLYVYRLESIPDGLMDVPLCPSIECDAVNAEARAAIVLLRAWINQSLDYAELVATPPEE